MGLPTSLDLQREADRAAARGAFADARELLDRAAALDPGSAELHLKRASMHRAAGDAPGALAAINAALAISPLDFVGLLLRASLLEQTGSGEAGEAYGRALAQRPSGALAPALTKMLVHAENAHAAHVAGRERRLAAAMVEAEGTATAEQAARMARFRTNAVRRTRVYHSEPTHFHYPGLIEREFHDRSGLPWLAELEAATDTIAAEFAAVSRAERAELVPYIQYASHEPLRQWQALNHSRDWTAIHLWQNGVRIEANARHCPETMALLQRFPQPRIAGCSPNAMFSLLAPQTTIPPHTGVANTRLVCHLPLIVPEGCWFRVGADTRPWKHGEAWVFDDTIEHEACNPTDQLRVILIIDVWHPGLAEAEQAAVRAMMEAEGAAAAAPL